MPQHNHSIFIDCGDMPPMQQISQPFPMALRLIMATAAAVTASSNAMAHADAAPVIATAALLCVGWIPAILLFTIAAKRGFRLAMCGAVFFAYPITAFFIAAGFANHTSPGHPLPVEQILRTVLWLWAALLGLAVVLRFRRGWLVVAAMAPIGLWLGWSDGSVRYVQHVEAQEGDRGGTPAIRASLVLPSALYWTGTITVRFNATESLDDIDGTIRVPCAGYRIAIDDGPPLSDLSPCRRRGQDTEYMRAADWFVNVPAPTAPREVVVHTPALEVSRLEWREAGYHRVRILRKRLITPPWE
jgi:hypothetical protein